MVGPTLNGVVLQNAGTATLATPGEMALQNGAGIDNQTSGSFTLQDNTTISSDSSPTYFNNEGSLIQIAGDQSTSIIRPRFHPEQHRFDCVCKGGNWSSTAAAP